MRVPRFTRVALTLTAIGIAFSMSATFYLSSTEDSDFDSVSILQYTQSTGQSFREIVGLASPCTTDDLIHGEWRERAPFTNETEVIDAYHYQSWNFWHCWPRVEEGHHHNDYSKELQFQQALRVAGPEYVPRGGCELPIPDMDDIVRHLLRIPGGMYMAGDSISAAWEYAFNNLLVGPNTPTRLNNGCKHRTITLDPNHPDVPALLRDAGVSAERLQFPLLSWYRSTWLANHDELGDAFSHVSDRFELLHTDECNVFDWFELMTAEIEEANNADIQYAPGVAPEPYILTVDTGPHWGKARLGETLSQDEIDIGYLTVAIIMEKKIRNVPWDMFGYFRTVSPAHFDCTSPTAYNDVDDQIDPLRPDSQPFNWRSFPFYNNIIRAITVQERVSTPRWQLPWQRRLEQDTPQKRAAVSAPDDPRLISLGPSEMAVNPPMRLLDIWHLTIKRPDAHLKPGNDCLHYCMTGVHDIWLNLFWRFVFEDARNGGKSAKYMYM